MRRRPPPLPLPGTIVENPSEALPPMTNGAEEGGHQNEPQSQHQLFAIPYESTIQSAGVVTKFPAEYPDENKTPKTRMKKFRLGGHSTTSMAYSTSPQAGGNGLGSGLPERRKTTNTPVSEKYRHQHSQSVNEAASRRTQLYSNFGSAFEGNTITVISGGGVPLSGADRAEIDKVKRKTSSRQKGIFRRSSLSPNTALAPTPEAYSNSSKLGGSHMRSSSRSMLAKSRLSNHKRGVSHSGFDTEFDPTTLRRNRMRPNVQGKSNQDVLYQEYDDLFDDLDETAEQTIAPKKDMNFTASPFSSRRKSNRSSGRLSQILEPASPIKPSANIVNVVDSDSDDDFFLLHFNEVSTALGATEEAHIEPPSPPGLSDGGSSIEESHSSEPSDQDELLRAQPPSSLPPVTPLKIAFQATLHKPPRRISNASSIYSSYTYAAENELPYNRTRPVSEVYVPSPLSSARSSLSITEGFAQPSSSISSNEGLEKLSSLQAYGDDGQGRDIDTNTTERPGLLSHTALDSVSLTAEPVSHTPKIGQSSRRSGAYYWRSDGSGCAEAAALKSLPRAGAKGENKQHRNLHSRITDGDCTPHPTIATCTCTSQSRTIDARLEKQQPHGRTDPGQWDLLHQPAPAPPHHHGCGCHHEHESSDAHHHTNTSGRPSSPEDFYRPAARTLSPPPLPPPPAPRNALLQRAASSSNSKGCCSPSSSIYSQETVHQFAVRNESPLPCEPSIFDVNDSTGHLHKKSLNITNLPSPSSPYIALLPARPLSTALSITDAACADQPVQPEKGKRESTTLPLAYSTSFYSESHHQHRPSSSSSRSGARDSALTLHSLHNNTGSITTDFGLPARQPGVSDSEVVPTPDKDAMRTERKSHLFDEVEGFGVAPLFYTTGASKKHFSSLHSDRDAPRSSMRQSMITLSSPLSPLHRTALSPPRMQHGEPLGPVYEMDSVRDSMISSLHNFTDSDMKFSENSDPWTPASAIDRRESTTTVGGLIASAFDDNNFSDGEVSCASELNGEQDCMKEVVPSKTPFFNPSAWQYYDQNYKIESKPLNSAESSKEERSPSTAPPENPTKDTSYLRTFRHHIKRSGPHDAFIQRQARFEFAQAERIIRKVKEIKTEPLSGKYKLAPKPVTKASKQNDANREMAMTLWNLMAERWLSFGRFVISPAHDLLVAASARKLNKRIKERKDKRASELLGQGVKLDLYSSERRRIMDLGGDPIAGWGWHCAYDYPQAKVYTVTKGECPPINGEDDPVKPDGPPGPRNHRHYIVSKLWETKFPDNHFDVISIRNLFSLVTTSQHTSVGSGRLLDEMDLVIEECNRILKPGGYLEFSVMDVQLLNAGPSGKKFSESLAECLEKNNQDAAPTTRFIKRLNRNGFKKVKRAWMFQPIGPTIINKPLAAPNKADYEKVPLPRLPGSPNFDAAMTLAQKREESIRKVENWVEAGQQKGDAQSVAAVTGLLAQTILEKWGVANGMDSKKIAEDLADVLREEIEGKKMAGFRVLTGYAMKTPKGFEATYA